MRPRSTKHQSIRSKRTPQVHRRAQRYEIRDRQELSLCVASVVPLLKEHHLRHEQRRICRMPIAGAPVSSLMFKLHVDAKVLLKIDAHIICQTPSFTKVSLMGEGTLVVVLSCSSASPCCPSGLRIKSAMT